MGTGEHGGQAAGDVAVLVAALDQAGHRGVIPLP
jgi:hypothetical protein